MLRGATEGMLDDVERAVDDGINAYKVSRGVHDGEASGICRPSCRVLRHDIPLRPVCHSQKQRLLSRVRQPLAGLMVNEALPTAVSTVNPFNHNCP